MNIITEEVRMAQHKCEIPIEGRVSNLEETLDSFIKEYLWRQKESENLVWRIKKNYDQTIKKQASSIKEIESHLGRIMEIIHGRGVRSLPSFTKTNPRGLAHTITTRSGLNYKPPQNLLKDTTDTQIAEEIPTNNEIALDNPKKTIETYAPPTPILGRLKKDKEKEQF
ncbi:hypothetical protein Tco_0987168 [Tanacetum coccineum]